MQCVRTGEYLLSSLTDVIYEGQEVLIVHSTSIDNIVFTFNEDGLLLDRNGNETTNAMFGIETEEAARSVVRYHNLCSFIIIHILLL